MMVGHRICPSILGIIISLLQESEIHKEFQDIDELNPYLIGCPKNPF